MKIFVILANSVFGVEFCDSGDLYDLCDSGEFGDSVWNFRILGISVIFLVRIYAAED